MRRQHRIPPRDVPGSARRLLRRESPSAAPVLFSPLFQAALGRTGVLLGAVVFVAVAVAGLRSESLGIVLGSTIGAAASVWAARRNPDDWRSWYVLAAAFFCLAAGRLLAEIAGSRSSGLGGASFVDLGTFGFAIGAAMCNVAWPEIRRSNPRSVATLADTLTLVVAAAVWGWAGFPPVGLVLPAAAGPALSRSADLLLPVITACIAAPQLGVTRRRSALGLAGGAGLLLLAEVLASPELATSVGSTIAWASQAVGFALLAVTVLSAARWPSSGSELPNEHGATPPFAVTGILGLLALIMAAIGLPRFGPPTPILLLVLAACLGVREVLKVLERRWANERLAASLGLEARLLALQSAIGPTTAPDVTLRQSCALAVEVLKTDVALAWLVEGDSLVLSAVAPERRESLIGRRMSLNDPESLAVRVLRSRAPEACSMSTPGARVNRFLTTVLHADSLLALPITNEASTSGVLVLMREEGKPAFTAFDQQKAALIAGQAAASLRRHELYGELESQLSETTLVHRFVMQAVAARTVNDVGWFMLESIRAHAPYERGVVYMTDSGPHGAFTPIAHFHNREPVVAPADPECGTADLSIPMLYGARATGQVELHRPGERPFTEHEIRLAQAIAQQASVAIQNILLREESGKVAMYREVDRLKTELLNNVSHDLRGPLTNIKWAASSLLQSDGDLSSEEALQDLHDIEDEADRLKDLLEHLLDLSRIDAGALRIDLQPVSLPRIVQELMFGLQEPKFRFECAVPSNLCAMADGRRLRQVLTNLLENAVKYSPDGGTIKVSACERPTEVEVSVSDEGVGIPRHQWDRLFRAYQRADSGTALGVAGNGLGLAICKGIVEAHGGRIWVDDKHDNSGKGTTFSFTVPRVPIEARGSAEA